MSRLDDIKINYPCQKCSGLGIVLDTNLILNSLNGEIF